jgi:hypothetical protein
MSQAWLLDAPDPPPARTSADVPSPGTGRRPGSTPAASRTRVGPCLGRCPVRGVAALGWGRGGWPPSPSAACQNWPSGFGVVAPCSCSVPEHLRLPEPGPSFREGRGRFLPVADVGYPVPRFASHDRHGRVVPPDKESRCDHQIPDRSPQRFPSIQCSEVARLARPGCPRGGDLVHWLRRGERPASGSCPG